MGFPFYNTLVMFDRQTDSFPAFEFGWYDYFPDSDTYMPAQ